MGRAAVLALALLAAGCGFQPLYGERSAGGNGRLAVAVAPLAEREGQALRAALRRAFDSSRQAEYQMDVTLRERVRIAAVDARGDAIRKRMTMTASWRLWPVGQRGEAKPVTGEARAYEAFNVLASDYANVTAERAARLRAVERLAHNIAAAATARVQAGKAK